MVLFHQGDQVHLLESDVIALKRSSLSLEEWCYCTRETSYPSIESGVIALEKPHTHPLESGVIALGRPLVNPLDNDVITLRRPLVDPLKSGVIALRTPSSSLEE